MAKKTEVETTLTISNLLADMPVVKESTTSRVVVNNPLLRVVIFAFAAGEMLTEHASPRAVVVQMVDGTLDWTMDGKTVELVAGDVVYLAPNHPHALVATSDCHLALTLVDSKYGAKLEAAAAEGGEVAGDVVKGEAN